jgi:hypothetical protein
LLIVTVGAAGLVSVTAQSVRERINLAASAVSDIVVNRFIADAATTLELETGLTIDPSACSEPEAVAIRNLAAVYCGAYITGGSASGLSFRVGDLSVDESQSANVSNANLQFLLDQAKAVIARLNVAEFRAVNAQWLPFLRLITSL